MSLTRQAGLNTYHPSPSENIDVIVFDLGNVLVQLDTAASLWPALDPHSEAGLLRQQSWGRHPAVRGYESGSIRDIETVYDRMRQDDPELIGREGFLAAFNRIIGTLYPQTIDLLTQLKGRYRLIMLSNTSPAHWQLVEQRDQLSPYFERCLLSYEIGCLKPDPRCYEILLDACRCQADKIIYFDDRPENIRQAELFGIKAYQTYGGHQIEILLHQLQLI